MPVSRIVVGRLLEIDLEQGFRSPQEVDEFGESSSQLIAREAPGRRLIAVSDWRRYRLSTPTVAERLTALLKGNSPFVERSAVLCDAVAPTVVLQLARLVHEANNPARRLFSDPAEVMSWLEDRLTPEEQVRLHAFLDLTRR